MEFFMRPLPLSRLLLATGLILLAAGYLLGGRAVLPHALAPMVRWTGLVLVTASAAIARSLKATMLVSMLIGIEIGLDAPYFASQLKFLSDIFLRGIKLLVAPLILGTLVTGIAGHGDLGQMRRIGIKALVYFELVTTLALLIGLAVANISQAGTGVHVSAPAPAGQISVTTEAHGADYWQHFFTDMIPDNIASAVAGNQILQIAVFAVLLGLGLALAPEEKRRPLLALAESVTAATFGMTRIVMYFAPVGIAAAIAYTVGRMGIAVLLPLGKLLVAFYAAVVAFSLLVLLPIAIVSRTPLRRFLSAISEPAALAFATSTSQAALPLAMENMEAMGIPRRIVSFVIPAGYSFNLDGSSLYLSLAALFAAQFGGMHLGWKTQLAMVFTMMIASKGVAAVPRSVLVVLLSTAATFHLPTEPILLMLGIDAFLDMGRSAMNVIGNCLASAVIARTEGVRLTPGTVVPSDAR